MLRIILSRLRLLIVAVWTTEPVRVTALVTSAVVVAGAAVGLDLDAGQVAAVAAVVLPVLLGGGEATRRRVSPHVGPIGEPNDESVMR